MVTTLWSVANRGECCLACFLTTFTGVKSQFFSSAGCHALPLSTPAKCGGVGDRCRWWRDRGSFFSLALFALAG